MEWTPIEINELENELSTELEALDHKTMKFFKSIECPIHSFPILREGVKETVFVVGRYKGYVIFYEDIHDSFEIAQPNSNGVIDDFVMYQAGLGFLINELQNKNS